MIRIVSHIEAKPFLERRSSRLDEAERIVAPILKDVRSNGDAAVLEYARKFDGLGVAEGELAAACSRLSDQIRGAIETARRNILEFAKAQLPREYFEEFSKGRKLGQIVRPLDAVGCYIPSGRYPLPSTLLMTAILAQAAGVPRSAGVGRGSEFIVSLPLFGNDPDQIQNRI